MAKRIPGHVVDGFTAPVYNERPRTREPTEGEQAVSFDLVIR